MGERCYFAHMEIVRTFSRSWGVLFALGLGAGAAWGQTIGNIPAQNHTAGQNIPTIHLSLSGFEDSRVLRMMAANTTSGNAQSYEEPGKRIFQGLKPDIVMIQEFQVANNTSTSVMRSWVDGRLYQDVGVNVFIRPEDIIALVRKRVSSVPERDFTVFCGTFVSVDKALGYGAEWRYEMDAPETGRRIWATYQVIDILSEVKPEFRVPFFNPQRGKVA